MALRLDFHCDDCNAELGEGDDLVCMSCYEKKGDETAALKLRIEELESEVDELTDKVESLENRNPVNL